MTEKTRIGCRRCLLKETDQAAYFKNLYEYIDNLDEDIKSTDSVYQRRLAECKNCDLLADGMCRGCGCFVELRAAIGTNHCPYDKWSV